MIALFAPSWDRATRMARHLHSATAEVDGPFRLYKGGIGAVEARVFAVEHGADAAWAAARIAARRGATLMLPLTECLLLAEKRNAPWHEAEPGTCLPVAGCWDLATLEPLMRLLPESAETMPLDPAAMMPRVAVLDLPREGITLGTLPWSTRNVTLLRWLHKHHGVGAFDLQLAGYAAAAQEDTGVKIAPMAMVVERLTSRGPERGQALAVERAVDEALDVLLAQIAESLT